MRVIRLLFIFFALPAFLHAQQQVSVVNPCGGSQNLTIPSIADNDADGMDDILEQKLLNRFMPTIIQFSGETCPGPALDGTGDSNLVVCHIYPIPQQYARTNDLDSVLLNPVAVVPAKGLIPGLVWYKPLVMVNCALLYGKDCGLLGHTSDVEGFSFSLMYTGADSAAGWMYDTIMTNWMGGTIQTVSHAGTACEQIETKPYKSVLNPNGVDTVLASPDKHGNYLTTGGCGASFICNPGCGGTPSKKNVRPVNIGEPNASLVPDLGTYYPAYAGNDPWSNVKFLDAQGGDAGTIRDKMIKPLSTDFVQGHTLTANDICPIYTNCYGSSGSAYMDYTCAGYAYNFWGQQLVAPGSYQHTVTNSYGCDSTITLNLAYFATDTTLSVAVCQGYGYMFNGQWLTTAGTYYDTLTASIGCDSIITLNLQVYPSQTDSTTAVVCAGRVYDFYGHQLTQPGNYSNILTNMYGCDSVILLTLVFDTVPPLTWNFNVDTVLLTEPDIILTGALPVGGIYSGPGVYGPFFIPDSAGFGAHTLTYTFTDSLGCSDSIKRTISVVVSGIEDIQENVLRLYPNPASERLFIELNEPISEPIHLYLYSATGQEMELPYQLFGSGLRVQTAWLPAGTYFVRLQNAEKRYRGTFTKIH
ncbi:MAG: T9SS type A sorting domain-containing protein [Chitinophagales bacterium]